MAETNEDGDLILTQEEFDRRVAEAAREQAEELLAARDDRLSETELRLAQTERELHTERVDKLVKGMQQKGHAPAVVKVAKEYLLADERRETVLELSQEGSDDPRYISATDIVLSILDALPESALTHEAIEVDLERQPTDDEKSPEEIADEAYDKLHGTESAAA